MRPPYSWCNISAGHNPHTPYFYPPVETFKNACLGSLCWLYCLSSYLDLLIFALRILSCMIALHCTKNYPNCQMYNHFLHGLSTCEYESNIPTSRCAPCISNLSKINQNNTIILIHSQFISSTQHFICVSFSIPVPDETLKSFINPKLRHAL